MNIQLYNTYSKKGLIFDENQNSILTLIKFRNTKILLAGDMTRIYDDQYNNYLGKINVLKWPHHCFGDIFLNNILKLKPDNIILSCNYIHPYTIKILKYLKNKFNPNIYFLKYINSSFSIKLHFNLKGKNEYYIDASDNFHYILTCKNKKLCLLDIILLIIVFITWFYKYISKKKG